MEILVCGIAMALGIFAAIAPGQAARILGSEKLARLDPESRVLFLRWYRIFGILLYLAGALFAADTILFPDN